MLQLVLQCCTSTVSISNKTLGFRTHTVSQCIYDSFQLVDLLQYQRRSQRRGARRGAAHSRRGTALSWSCAATSWRCTKLSRRGSALSSLCSALCSPSSPLPGVGAAAVAAASPSTVARQRRRRRRQWRRSRGEPPEHAYHVSGANLQVSRRGADLSLLGSDLLCAAPSPPLQRR